MTWRLIGPAWKVEGLTMAERVVLLALVSFTNEAGGNAYPSISTLSERCCCNRSTVHRALKSLCTRGLISPQGKGRKGTIKYRVCLTVQHGVSHTATDQSRSATPTMRTVPHNPSNNPSNYPRYRNPSDLEDSTRDSYFDSDSDPSVRETIHDQAMRLDRARRQQT